MEDFGVGADRRRIASIPARKRPDVFISDKASPIAIRLAEGTLSTGRRAARNFGLKNWLESDGDLRPPKEAADGKGFFCDALGCTAQVRGLTLAMPETPSAIDADCRRADIVIVPFPHSAPCMSAKLVVDAQRLKALGTHALYIGHDGEVWAQTVHPFGRQRPWSRVPPRAKIHRTPAGQDRAETEPKR